MCTSGARPAKPYGNSPNLPTNEQEARARSSRYLIEPIWKQLAAVLPEREVEHPLGCCRSRVPDRVAFEKLVQVLVFDCAYWQIADEMCSATTLRRRRDEWIARGVIDELRRAALEAYDRIVG